jgi:N-methylhydantoinase A
MLGLVGVDVGGTFTDLVYSEDGAQASRVLKVPSTPQDPATGVLDALVAADLDPAGLEAILHGTTIATNAVIERTGAACALVTTRGFRDVLELGRRDRPSLYGLTGTQDPLIARDRRFEVTERLGYDGEVQVPIDPDEVRQVAAHIGEIEDVETVVVSLLHSYANPAHEQQIADILREVQPDWHVVTSSTVVREYYEFERTSTAVVQGYLQPLVSRYAASLQRRLRDWGFEREVFVMQSNGGVVAADKLGERAAHIIRSGPAAGVTAAARIAEEVGFHRIITADMGGTSFDVAVVIDGEAKVAESTELDFRVPLRVPMLDIHTIGAGGGSIASLDRGGVLQVGPRSAGSYPGPIAFNRGGTEPTVTDAHVVLGRINSDRPIGANESAALDIEGARVAIAQLGDQLGLSVEEMAEAILAVVNTRMAGRMRLISVEQGYDPRDFALVAFGGAGPLHGASLLREVGVRTMLVPPTPGVLCALGCVMADLRFDLSRTVERRVDRLETGELGQLLEKLRQHGEAELHAEGTGIDRVAVTYHADMAYLGQVHRLRVSIDPRWGPEELQKAFDDAYSAEFGATLGNMPLLMVNVRASVRGVRRRGQHVGDAGQSRDLPPPGSRRPVFFDGTWHDTAVYQRVDLRPGMALDGPAIVEQEDTTIVIEPSMHTVVDARGNLQIEVQS